MPETASYNRQIKNYRVVNLLGQGGMAEVYLALDPENDRYLALKVVPAQLAADVQYRKRFLREVEEHGKLDHPNIVKVYDGGEADGKLFMAMEFVEGWSLDKFLNQYGKLPIPIAIYFLRGILRGLAYTHQSGIIHRDIKPANILVSNEGEVKITDFGILKGTDNGPGLTQAGDVIGSPAYMAPEQILGGEVRPSIDLYASGLMFYQFITGFNPNFDENVHQCYQKVLKPNIPPIIHYAPYMTEELWDLVDHMLQTDSAKRYKTAEDILGDLEIATAEMEPLSTVDSFRQFKDNPDAWRRKYSADAAEIYYHSAKKLISKEKAKLGPVLLDLYRATILNPSHAEASTLARRLRRKKNWHFRAVKAEEITQAEQKLTSDYNNLALLNQLFKTHVANGNFVDAVRTGRHILRIKEDIYVRGIYSALLDAPVEMSHEGEGDGKSTGAVTPEGGRPSRRSTTDGEPALRSAGPSGGHAAKPFKRPSNEDDSPHRSAPSIGEAARSTKRPSNDSENAPRPDSSPGGSRSTGDISPFQSVSTRLLKRPSGEIKVPRSTPPWVNGTRAEKIHGLGSSPESPQIPSDAPKSGDTRTTPPEGDLPPYDLNDALAEEFPSSFPSPPASKLAGKSSGAFSATEPPPPPSSPAFSPEKKGEKPNPWEDKPELSETDSQDTADALPPGSLAVALSKSSPDLSELDKSDSPSVSIKKGWSDGSVPSISMNPTPPVVTPTRQTLRPGTPNPLLPPPTPPLEKTVPSRHFKGFPRGEKQKNWLPWAVTGVSLLVAFWAIGSKENWLDGFGSGGEAATRISISSLSQARMAMKANNPEQAAVLYRKFIDDDAGNPVLIEAKFGLARALEDADKITEAKVVLQGIFKEYNSMDYRNEAERNLAKIALKGGATKEAVTLYADIIEHLALTTQRQRQADLLLEYSETLGEDYKFDDAYKTLENVVNSYSDVVEPAWVFIKEAKLEAKMGKKDIARQTAAKAMTDPKASRQMKDTATQLWNELAKP